MATYLIHLQCTYALILIHVSQSYLGNHVHMFLIKLHNFKLKVYEQEALLTIVKL